MGISSMPTPRDSLLVFVLYSMAVSIAFLVNLAQTVLVFLGLAMRGDMEERPVVSITPMRPSLSDRFRTNSVHRIMVNWLPCGHLFHRACLETWLDYNHATCPLCRLYLLPAAVDLLVLAVAAGPAPHLTGF
ncbi:hypothetical protein BS78_07G175400 [Paspalum vaginatum]|nr:hypothetical protein BS78_07G175400 [Paspalum vaginatum]